MTESLVGFEDPLLPEVRMSLVTPPALQGALTNPEEVGEQTLDVGITTPSVSAHMALEGKGPFARSFPELKAIAAYPHMDRLVFMVEEEAGLHSLKELNERRYPLRVVTGRRTRQRLDVLSFTVNEILKQYGVSFEQIEQWGGKVFYGGPTHVGGTLMEQGDAEALFHEAWHQPIWFDIASSQEVRVLPLDEDVLKHMEDKYGFRRTIVPEGSYDGLVTEDLPTLGFDGWLVFTNSDLPDEWAFALAQACDRTRKNVEKLIKQRPPKHRSIDVPIDPEFLFGETVIPLHPGARNYAKEHHYI